MRNRGFFVILLIMFALIGAAVINGCSKSPRNVGADGYYFEKETFTHTSFPVEVVLVQSDAEMVKLIREAKNIQGEIDPKAVAAFSSLRSDGRCKIYMIDPKIRYEPQWYGHEFVHCVYGVWHQEPQSGR
jgi:hypothetical protein